MNRRHTWPVVILAEMVLFHASGLTAEPPKPGIGLFFQPAETAAMREKVKRPPCQALHEELLKKADAALGKWARDRGSITALAPQLPDLVMETVPDQYAPAGGKAAGQALAEYAEQGAPAAAYAYLMTGDLKYAQFAWQVFEQCARVNRWGWFPWGGSHMPQIHFAIIGRNLAFVADSIWETLAPAQRQRAREIIAEKCVEPYYRMVLHTPGMGLFHLRSRNQGNNALSAAMVGSLFVGEAAPENRIWFNSLLQTYHWAITHDIGWMGQGLEMNLGGYWSVSLQNLYTAAVALNRVKGIDLRDHPGFEQATLYPLAHEASVPPMRQDEPIPPGQTPPVMGYIDDKPLSLPGNPEGAAWWLDYAARFPGSAAHYFAHTALVREDRLRIGEAHQGALGLVLPVAWWKESVKSPPKPPSAPALFTDRIAALRSGHGFGQTYLYFNGDLFLSARKEVLGATAGLAWHFPWHQYQITETGIETEGELFAPSMGIREARHNAHFTWFRAEPAPSNITYYQQGGQLACGEHYARRSRSVLYVRARDQRPDYFIFDDVVRLRTNAPLWHAWTWHLWSPAGASNNWGKFVVQGKNAVRALRPNADLWIQFLTPPRLAFEMHGIPSQPNWAYDLDHNAQMLRAVAGQHAPATAKPVVISPSAWGGLGVAQPGALYLAKPPTDTAHSTGLITNLAGGVRYRWSLRCREEDYYVYEATAWEISLELLDARGNVVASPSTSYGHPHPLKLGAPLSSTRTHGWVESAQYFDAPLNATACRATFRAVGGAHGFKLGKLWLGPISLLPLGRPARVLEQRFVVVVMPLDKDAPAPRIETDTNGITRIFHAGDAFDEITLAAEESLNVIQKRGGESLGSFSTRVGAGGAPLADLKSNSDASANTLAAGLKPVWDQLTAERDALIRRGRENLALGATVTASASRDDRFAPAKVCDNLTGEYPVDGHLDYTQGIVTTSGRFIGYGMERSPHSLAGGDFFPLYVRPTYWLLPPETNGWVELKLKRPATVNLVRLLNTSNAGLNDFACHHFRVELYDADHQLLAHQEGMFGQVHDRPFKQAFFVPAWFSQYTRSFAGLLDPGVTVPFGDGWKEVPFKEEAPRTLFVRVLVTKYWGLGGGLNEVQVYGR